MYTLQLLGPVTLAHAGRPLALPTAKVQALLLLLALRGPQHRAPLAAWLWPARDDTAARRNLRRELARVRECGAGALLQSTGDVLALAPLQACDVHRFEASAAVEPLAALALWRGELAAGLHLDGAEVFMQWLADERRRLATLRRSALQAAASAQEAAGDLPAALRHTEALLADDPLQEHHHRDAMRLNAALGWREAALQQYARCRALLAAELGLMPMPETEALAAALRQGGGMAGTPKPGTLATATATATPIATTPIAATPIAAKPIAAIPNAAGDGQDLPLVGRDSERAWLQAAWASGRPLLVEGEAGIGKTRLVCGFAAAQGAYALAQCRTGDADLPYASFTRALRLLAGPVLASAGLPGWMAAELAHLLPELGSTAPRIANAEDRSRLHEACVAAWSLLAGDSFDAVLIDDWHWADTASRLVFGQVAQQRNGARLVLLLRPELDEAASASLQALRRDVGAQHLRLEALAEPALRELVMAAAAGAFAAASAATVGSAGDGAAVASNAPPSPAPGLLQGTAPGIRLHPAQHPPHPAQRPAQDLTHHLVQHLSRATGGNPFFVTETLRHWQALGLLRGATPPDALPLPGSVREAVLARVARLPRAAQRLLEAACLAAEPFTPSLLAGACALSELEALDGVEQALATQLLREQGGGYAFAHDLVQWALEGALSTERRRLVHRKLALGGAGAGLAPAEVARHWESGGEPQRAVAHRLAAADAALALASDDVAMEHWQHALADGPTPAQHLYLLERRAGVLRMHDDGGALAAVIAEIDQLCAAWAQHPATATLAQEAAVLVAQMQSVADQSAAALALVDSVLATLAPTATLRSRALLVRSQALNGLGRSDEGAEVARAALALGGLDPLREGQLLYSLVYSHFLRSEPAQALPYAQRNVLLWQAIGARRMVVRAHANVGLLQSMLGDQPAAMAAMGQALAIARDLRMVETQRELANNMADVHLTRGEPQAAIALAREALGLSAEFTQPSIAVFLLGECVQGHYHRGELGAALDVQAQAFARAQAVGLTKVRLDNASMALDLFTLLGDEPGAHALLAAVEGRDTTGLEHFTVKLAFNRVRLALARGDTALARAALAPMADIGALQEKRDRQHAALCHAGVLQAEGDAAAGLQCLQAWDMADAHVEVGARAAALGLQLALQTGADTAAALAEVDAWLARDHTPVPALPELLQARGAAARADGQHTLAHALQAREAAVWQRLAASLPAGDRRAVGLLGRAG